MSGNAKSQKFMLSTAEVMIGDVEDLYALTPVEHGVGLVKNFTIEASKEQTELTQGRTNDVIASVTTSATTRGTFEMYEYTTRNLSYALGLEGKDLISSDKAELTASASFTFSSGSATITLADASDVQNLTSGDRVMLKNPETQAIFVATVTSGGVSGNVSSADTVDVTIPDTTDATAFPAGSSISLVNVLAIGDTDVDRYYSAKIQGQLADGQWVVLYLPKIRVTSGLSMAFSTDSFGNMPFEFTPLKPTLADPYYSQFKGRAGELLTDTVTSALA